MAKFCTFQDRWGWLFACTRDKTVWIRSSPSSVPSHLLIRTIRPKVLHWLLRTKFSWFGAREDGLHSFELRLTKLAKYLFIVFRASDEAYCHLLLHKSLTMMLSACFHTFGCYIQFPSRDIRFFSSSKANTNYLLSFKLISTWETQKDFARSSSTTTIIFPAWDM